MGSEIRMFGHEISKSPDETIVSVKFTNARLSYAKSLIEPRLDKHVKTVKIFNSDTIFIDCDLRNDIWHGKNLAIYTETLVITDNPIIDLSGLAQHKKLTKAQNSKNEHENGKDGLDGQSGESSGHFLIVASKIKNFENLKVILNGANGQDGQEGGDGFNGMNGAQMHRTEFEKIMPKFGRYISGNTEKYLLNFQKFRWKKAQSLMYHEIDTYDHYEGVNPENGIKCIFSISLNMLGFVHAYMLVQGARATKATGGGIGGLGGQRGHKGKCVVMLKNSEKIELNVESMNGRPGKSGKNGKNGVLGKDGCDVGFIQTPRIGSNKRKVFGGENQKIRLNFSRTPKENACYSAYIKHFLHEKECYITMNTYTQETIDNFEKNVEKRSDIGRSAVSKVKINDITELFDLDQLKNFMHEMGNLQIRISSTKSLYKEFNFFEHDRFNYDDEFFRSDARFLTCKLEPESESLVSNLNLIAHETSWHRRSQRIRKFMENFEEEEVSSNFDQLKKLSHYLLAIENLKLTSTKFFYQLVNNLSYMKNAPGQSKFGEDAEKVTNAIGIISNAFSRPDFNAAINWICSEVGDHFRKFEFVTFNGKNGEKSAEKLLEFYFLLKRSVEIILAMKKVLFSCAIGEVDDFSCTPFHVGYQNLFEIGDLLRKIFLLKPEEKIEKYENFILQNGPHCASFRMIEAFLAKKNSWFYKRNEKNQLHLIQNCFFGREETTEKILIENNRFYELKPDVEKITRWKNKFKLCKFLQENMNTEDNGVMEEIFDSDDEEEDNKRTIEFDIESLD